MLRALRWLSVACLLSSSYAATRHTVGVFMQFDRTGLSAASLEAMEAEAEELLRDSGVLIDWQLAKDNHGKQSFSSLVMLKFRGTCRADWSRSEGGEFGTLGEEYALGITRVAHGQVLPYTEVECDQIRQALMYVNRSAGRRERQRVLGRAIGRVVAHELYHILARTTKHAAQGLAKASQSLEDLVSSRNLVFRAEDSRAIEHALEAAAPTN